MISFSVDDREAAFLEQRHLFLRMALEAFGFANIEQVPDFSKGRPVPLPPVVISDFTRLTPEDVAQLSAMYYGEFGVAHFIVLNANAASKNTHPLLDIANQLTSVLPLNHPIAHPMECHPEAISRFGPPDGTLKIYDLQVRDGSTGYREQAETSEMFDSHNDGLGYGGSVEALMFYTDSVPLWGGYTYFSNLVALSLHLAHTDPDAFASLFLPNAITAIRPRGKGAIKVVSPVLFLNEDAAPQSFFRISTGEYDISWRPDCPPLSRASAYLNTHAQPFAQGTSFVHFDRPGAGCIVRNGWVAHGRTPYRDGPDAGRRRVLARKWFMRSAADTKYKHVPGMGILPEFAAIYPEQFGPGRLIGEWNLDPLTGTNIRRI